MKPYYHHVNYYETDKMAVTHHSNYIRWMEEARIDFLEQIGFGYRKLEEDGIVSPVIGVTCEYKASTAFGDSVRIDAFVKEFSGVRLVIGYEMRNADTGALVLTGETRHCFIDGQGHPVILARSFPAFAQKLKEMKESAETAE